MAIPRVSSPIDIALSGMKAEGMRMNVISNNIANANTVKTAESDPYRRQDVIFTPRGEGMEGVTIEGVLADETRPFERMYSPGHPAADSSGYVTLSNVDVPTELMNMVVASRSYQANATVVKRTQDMNDATLELLR